MTTKTWIDIEDSFPPLYTPVLVSGGTASPDEPGAVQVVARLADAWEASEAEGVDLMVWADDETGEELAFDPMHWRPVAAQVASPT